MTARSILLVLAVAVPWGCGSSTPSQAARQSHSGPMAVSLDGSHLFVVHPDADSVSVLDLATRSIESEILLASVAPAVDGTTPRCPPARWRSTPRERRST
jgi:hypothetical protein